MWTWQTMTASRWKLLRSRLKRTARYVHEAARNGWVVGYPDGLFHGEDEITRAEVVTIVNRMLGRVADEIYIRRNKDEPNTFYDLQNPHYRAYYDLMEAPNGHTIVTGAEYEMA